MKNFSESLIDWYRQNARPLPWRETRDPYPIWLSEVILQQTRVAQGMQYYYRFLETFPTLPDLARASQEDVLRIWQGLGYYSRARNLHQTAQTLARDYGAVFPGSYAGLIQLKGIGDYTASAIASFAFHEDVVVVDGNVLRVFARWLGTDADIALPKTRKEIKSAVEALLPKGESWLFNQAIMELGALVCVPRKPACTACPVADSCMARKNQVQDKLPVKSKANAKKRRYLNYLLVESGDRLFFRQRSGKDIWEGLFEPILMESDRLFSETSDFLAHLPSPLSVSAVSLFPPVRHILSHQELWVRLCQVRTGAPPDLGEGRWVEKNALADLPLPVIFSKILNPEKGRTLPLTF